MAPTGRDLDHLYSHRRWRRRRLHQFRIEPVCRLCAQQGKTVVATVVDHVVPHKGSINAFWLGELQSLCKRCHDGLKQQQERHGYARGCDASDMPLDAGHPAYRGSSRD